MTTALGLIKIIHQRFQSLATNRKKDRNNKSLANGYNIRPSAAHLASSDWNPHTRNVISRNHNKSNNKEFRDIIPSKDIRCPKFPVRIEHSSSQFLLNNFVVFVMQQKQPTPRNDNELLKNSFTTKKVNIFNHSSISQPSYCYFTIIGKKRQENFGIFLRATEYFFII